ncbi:MAG: hypothetical protein ACREB5_03210, partial [Sphingomonadaceae bacterium]
MPFLAAAAGIGLSAQAVAAGTPAGTIIDNVATASYTPSGGGPNVSVPSNTVSLTVDELLDVTVASADPGDIIAAPAATNQVTSFTVTNTGNGSEAFTLSGNGANGGDDFDPAITSIVLDSNGNGVYDPGTDAVYNAGVNDPVLTPDASVRVFVLASIPAGATDTQRGEIKLAAVAKTGSGTPGTSFPGAGQGGGDAVVGATGADGDDNGFYRITAANVAIVKSASVADIWGGTEAVPGSTITYTLVATTTGSGSLTNLAINDVIPTGTTYKPASITLQGSSMTDAGDADAGEFNGTGFIVRLGDLSGNQARTVTFKVL